MMFYCEWSPLTKVLVQIRIKTDKRLLKIRPPRQTNPPGRSLITLTRLNQHTPRISHLCSRRVTHHLGHLEAFSARCRSSAVAPSVASAAPVCVPASPWAEPAPAAVLCQVNPYPPAGAASGPSRFCPLYHFYLSPDLPDTQPSDHPLRHRRPPLLNHLRHLRHTRTAKRESFRFRCCPVAPWSRFSRSHHCPLRNQHGCGRHDPRVAGYYRAARLAFGGGMGKMAARL